MSLCAGLFAAAACKGDNTAAGACSATCACDVSLGCDGDCDCDQECGNCLAICSPAGTSCECDVTFNCDPGCGHCDAECDCFEAKGPNNMPPVNMAPVSCDPCFDVLGAAVDRCGATLDRCAANAAGNGSNIDDGSCYWDHGFCGWMAFYDNASCIESSCRNAQLAAESRCGGDCVSDLGDCRQSAVWNASTQSDLDSRWNACSTTFTACTGRC